MKVEIIVSAMNIACESEYKHLLSNMKTNTNTLVINQITREDIQPLNIEKSKNRMLSFKEKGLSKSRNKAINNAIGDILVIADDDMEYLPDVEKTILREYNKYTDADIIIFYVESTNKERPTNLVKPGIVDYNSALKTCSVEITMKRKSIISNGIRFNENFGSGAKYNTGEENIFLFECLKKGLKIYSVNDKIGIVHQEESMWFKGFDEKYFKTKGACYVELYGNNYEELIIDFATRKQELYAPMTFNEAVDMMNSGAKEYRQERTKGDN